MWDVFWLSYQDTSGAECDARPYEAGDGQGDHAHDSKQGCTPVPVSTLGIWSRPPAA